MYDDDFNDSQEFMSELGDSTSELREAGQEAAYGVKRGFKAFARKWGAQAKAVMKDISQKILSAIKAVIHAIISAIISLGPVIIIILIALIIFLGAYYTWFQGERGTSASRSLKLEDENVTVIDEGTGTITAVALSENQAVIDAYYKYLSCQSYTKYFNGEEVHFEGDTQDFAGLEDYYSEEKNYYLSHNFIYMADEILHDGEFYYPEHIIMPVNYEIVDSDTSGDKIARTVSLNRDNRAGYQNIENIGFGSVLTYKADQKDNYVDATVTSFEVDWDYRYSFPGGFSYTHFKTERFYIVNSTGSVKSVSTILSEIDAKKEQYQASAGEAAVIAHYPDLYALTGENSETHHFSRTENGVTTNFGIHHMPQAVTGKDKEIDNTTFAKSSLSAFNAGKGDGLYPVTIPLITSAATFSGNIEYTYEYVTHTDELKDGTSKNIYDPVTTWQYDLGCKDPDDRSTTGIETVRHGTASKDGYLIMSVPMQNGKTPDPDAVTPTVLEADEIDFSGNPWGYEYFDQYVSGYQADVPADVFEGDFIQRIKDDENAMDLMIQLGLLRTYSGTGSLDAVDNFSIDDLELLARIIHNEAGNNKWDELLVGAVVLNRKESSLFAADTVLDVINSPGQYDIRDHFNEEPTDREWQSAYQCLSGEFAIPSNVVGQSASLQFDGLWAKNENGEHENTHYYCYSGPTISAVDRLGRTALTVEEARALADALDTSGATLSITKTSNYAYTPDKDVKVSRVSGSGAFAEVISGVASFISGGSGDIITTSDLENGNYYAVDDFNVLTATNTLKRIAEPQKGFFGSILSSISSSSDIFRILSNRNYTATIELIPYTRTNLHDKDARRIVYQAITLDEKLTYQDVVDTYSQIENEFLFMGDRSEQVLSYVISYTGSTLPGWISPTEYSCTPTSTFAGASGKGVELAAVQGDVLLSLYAGEVTKVTTDSIEITYNEVDGTIYKSTYSGIVPALTEGTEVHTGDTVAHVGESNQFVFEFQNETGYLEPMSYFYQMTYSGGGSNVVEVALAEYYACKANPYGFDRGKYEREINGTNNGWAWCAYFASWCIRQVYGETAYYNGQCHNWVKTFRENDPNQTYWADSQINGGAYIPQPGDLILYHWDKVDDRLANHIGVVIGVENGKVISIEGNTTPDYAVADDIYRVGRKEHSLGSKSIVGYVKYSLVDPSNPV